MKMNRIARVPWGRRRLSAVAVVLLAAFGVPGVVQSGALASSSAAPTWTELHPATQPPARYGAAMTYDAATGNVVLFGGEGKREGTVYHDTWTWNGTTWTEQSPTTSPPASSYDSMVYDAATGNVVLLVDTNPAQTWVWDGSTWTEQQPATSPPPRTFAAMTYDASTGNVVLFGGYSFVSGDPLGDTWVWDGSTWTQQQPATSPSAREGPSMAYDAATGNVVLFGGETVSGVRPYGNTWVWDGSTWTEQHPATSAGARECASMAYDASTGNVVLFGGYNPSYGPFGNTWIWDGSTWTKQSPTTHPSDRQLASMTYDAATGNVVLFGGLTNAIGLPATRGSTWIWG
jgi:hypothetical protein